MKKIFSSSGSEFDATNDAEQWCRDRDITVGPMARDLPRGLMRGPCVIAKWTNLSDADRAKLDGTMTGNMRHGPVAVNLSGDEAEYEARAQPLLNRAGAGQ